MANRMIPSTALPVYLGYRNEMAKGSTAVLYARPCSSSNGNISIYRFISHIVYLPSANLSFSTFSYLTSKLPFKGESMKWKECMKKILSFLSNSFELTI